MGVFHPIDFNVLTVQAKTPLKKIEGIIRKNLGEREAQNFQNARECQDVNQANQIIEELIKKLMHSDDSVLGALDGYAKKFSGVFPELEENVASAISEEKKIKILDNYYSEIKNIVGKKNGYD